MPAYASPILNMPAGEFRTLLSLRYPLDKATVSPRPAPAAMLPRPVCWWPRLPPRSQWWWLLASRYAAALEEAGHRSLRGKTGQKKLGMGGRWGFLLLTCRLEMDGNGNVWFQHVSAATKVSQDKHLSLVIGSQYWQLSGTQFLNSNHNWYSLWIQLNYMLNSIIELYWIICLYTL